MTPEAHLRNLYGMVAILAVAPLVSVGTLLLSMLFGAAGLLLGLLASIAYAVIIVGVFANALHARRALQGNGQQQIPHGAPLAASLAYGDPAPASAPPKIRKPGKRKAARSLTRPAPGETEPDPWRD